MDMNRRNVLRLAAGGFWAAALPTRGGPPKPPRPTNLILIVTDNQGDWMLGCYGNPDIRTPNIDRLSREGIRFTRAFASNAVCSPTRATLLTGLIPSQHGVHCYLSANKAQMGPKAYCTIKEFTTLPKILSAAGYACGLVGKWHLGDNLRPQEGFTYWVTMPHGHTTTFYGAEIIEDGQVRKEAGYLTDFWTGHALRFIERNKDRPFFLLLTYNGPYGLGTSLTQPARNRHAAWYADKDLPSFPRTKMHPWLRANRQYLNNITAIRRTAAETSGVDDGVGEVMAAIKRLGLDERTLVVYTADQGWAGGQGGLWGMGDHTRPIHAFDSTMHVPLIFRHAGAIPAGATCDRMVCNYDLMPTLLTRLGLKDKMSDKPRSPGRNFSAMLGGQSPAWDDVIFFEFENTRCIRTGDWKYIERHPDGPNELYDLRADPAEARNLVDSPAVSETRRVLKARLEEFFRTYADPKYDVWKGGTSKAGRFPPPAKTAEKTGSDEA